MNHFISIRAEHRQPNGGIKISIQFSSDFNKYLATCRKRFDAAKANYLANMESCNSALDSYLRGDNREDSFTTIRQCIMNMQSSYGDMGPYLTQKFPIRAVGTQNLDSFFGAFTHENAFEFPGDIREWERIVEDYRKMLLSHPAYFEFDEEKCMQLYRKYVGDAIQSNVNDSIKKSWQLWLALITAIISFITAILGIFHIL